MNLSTQPYKGTRDFYPEDQRVQKYIFNTWRKVVESYGYEEYDAPLLELTDIYKAKTGEEIVNNQIYNFEDRGGREVTIRPEMTPSVSRMVAGRRQEISYPARWYSIPNLWRYERPQHGRLREHWQLNVDIFGVSTIDAEIEMISIADDLMKAFGATSDMYTIKINSRKLSALLFADHLQLNATGSHSIIKLIDKKDKMSEDQFNDEAKQIFGGSDDSLQKFLRLMTSSSMADLPESLQESKPMREIQLLFTHLKENGIDNVTFDLSIMRGFDYYTDVVFEVTDNHPDNSRSLFGGGRYDGLVGVFGVEPVPTVGFGFGDVRLLDFLKSHELLPELPSETQIYIVVIGDLLRQAQGVAGILRQSGVNVAVGINAQKPDKQIRTALKKSIPYVMFIGEEELSTERFSLKNLAEETEEKLSIQDITTKVSSK